MGQVFLYDLSAQTKDDALGLFCDKLLGRGISRTVYSCKFNSKLVVKVCDERNGSPEQNWREWLVWQAARNTAEDWLAACEQISPGGFLLMQQRTVPVTLDELKKNVPKVPYFLTDLKVQNWGRIGKKYVAHDYGTCFATEEGIRHRLVKAKWWDNGWQASI